MACSKGASHELLYVKMTETIRVLVTSYAVSKKVNNAHVYKFWRL